MKELIWPAAKALLIIILVLLVLNIVCGYCGSLTTYRFEAPGATGMVSNYDAGMLRPTDALYMLNGYVTETPGMFERRTAIADYGGNATSLYGAFGYYNPLTGDKLILGVTDHGIYEQQVVKCTVTVVANNTAYDDTINADVSPSTYTSDGNATEAEITAGLVAAINADADVNGSVTAYDSTTFYIVQGDAAGVGFTIAVDTIQDTTTTQVCTTSYELGMFVVSDTFGTEVGYDTLGGTIFPYADVYHDFTPYKDIVVCADGKSIPCLFSTSQGFLYTRSKPDTLGYEPHFMSMGLEAPGQLRVGIVDAGGSGNLNGTYTYAVVFQSDSVLSIQSRPITVTNASIYITNLPMNKPIHILRKSGQEENQWYKLYSDSIYQLGFYHIDTGLTYDTALTRVVRWKTGGDTTSLFDTLPTPALGGYDPRGWSCGAMFHPCVDGDLNWYDSLGYRRVIDGDTVYFNCSHYCETLPWTVTTDVDSFTIDSFYTLDPYEPASAGRRPGQFYLTDTIGAVDTGHASKPDSLHYIAYSYYDPITGIESPLGPLLACSLTLSYVADSVKAKSFAFDDFDTTLNPGYVRVYQTVTKTTLPGASDSMVLYGLFQLRNLTEEVIAGQWNDDDVATGLDTSYLEIGQYYTHEMLRNDLGGVKILPPYNYDCRIPFSDIEYMAGQLWGIGDPDYPNFVYFSEYDWPGLNIFSWYPLDFIQIQEIGNDELVKIERAEGFGADALYVFAHNSVWLLNTSGDYQAISTRIGAASQETVVKHGESVYFLSPNMRFYVLAGGQLQEISQPVENYVETVFVDWDIYASGHAFGDYVRWFNSNTGMGLSLNTKSGAWTLERYGSGVYVPRGSFIYDTSSADVALTYDLELLYTDDTISLRKAEADSTYDVAGAHLENAIQSAYWTPHMPFTTSNRYHQVQQIDMTLNVRSQGALHYTIYNQDGDSLCGDSVSLLYSDTVVQLRIHTPYNCSLRPSVKVYSNDTDSIAGPVYYYHNFGIVDMTVNVRDMGVERVQ